MILHHIQEHLRASVGPDAPRVGPFRLTYAADTDNPFRNYAIPDDGVPTPADVAALRDWFRARGRRPRLEYVSPAAAEPALLAAGFTVERRLPLMVLDPPAVPEPLLPDGAVVGIVTGDDDLRSAAAVQNTAYGSGKPTDADVGRLRNLTTRGGAVALARVDGMAASSGVVTAPRDGLAEVAAVGTLEAYRRRGLAGAVVALLSATALERGATPYLQAESEREARLYARLGYTTIGSLTLANGEV